MAEYYCFSDAPAGGNGSLGNPWNSLATALSALKTTLAGAGAGAGSNLNLRGEFIGQFNIDSISGTSGSKFGIRTDPGAPAKAIINGDFAHPSAMNNIVFNWYRNSSGQLAGSGWGGSWVWQGLLRCIGSAAYVKFGNLIVKNSRSQGISCGTGCELDGCEVFATLLYPVGGDFILRNCDIHDYSQINYRGAQSVVFPIIGGVVCSGENGAAGANKSKTTLTKVYDRLLENCRFYNSGGEAVNIWSADGVTVRGCEFFNHFTVGLYLHNDKDVVAENNLFYYDESSWLFDFPRYAVMSAADLVYPGFPTSIFHWTSEPPAGGTALADPHLSGGAPQMGSGLVIGTEFPQIQAGENVHIRNNVFYRSALREYNVNASGYVVPWSATNRLQTGLRIEHNTFVESPGSAGLALNGGIAHPSASVKNNLFDQAAASPAPQWNNSEVTASGNVFRLNPGAGYVGGTNLVADPKLTKGSAINRTYFLPLVGSGAIGKGVTIADITTDAAGNTRGTPPTAGAMEYVLSAPEEEEPVPDTSRMRVSKWLIYIEGDDTTTDLVIPEIEFAALPGGAALTASKTVTASDVVSNPGNAFDGNLGTSATANAAAAFIVTFAEPQAIEEVRVRYPDSVASGSTGPVRIAVAIEHPITRREIPMAERVNIVPVAGSTVSLSVNSRLGQVRALRRRALAALRAARG